MNNTIIALDFDGTVVSHHYVAEDPYVIGEDIGAAKYLKLLHDNGVRFVLNTMRSGAHLQSAVRWFERNGIPLHGVNENPDQKFWTTSPKVYAQMYIDDASFGCPLKKVGIGQRPYVNWRVVGNRLLKQFGIVKKK